MLCPECKKDIKNYKQYIIHLELIHKITNYFICPIENCNRTYDTKYSLKYHLTVFHKSFQERRLDSNEIEKSVTPLLAESDSINNIKSIPAEKVAIDITTSVQMHPDPKANVDDILQQIQSNLNCNVVSFITNLYNSLDFPRSKVQNLIDSLKSFITSSLNPVKELIKILKSNDKLDENILKTIKDVVNMFENCFNAFDTEHKIVCYFSKGGKMVHPVRKKIGVSKFPKRSNTVAMQLKDEFVYLLPLRNTLKLFLELPNVFDTIINYQKDLLRSNDDVLRNVVNGTLWNVQKEKSSELDELIPLFVYYDDFESGNPLGSHAGQHKIGAVYSTLGTIPPQYAARLENVFLTFLFYSKQRTRFGNQKTFEPLLTELKFLETTGIKICHNQKELNIKFPLIVLCGDNLGLNSILGCVESFSSNIFCRICTMNKSECQTEVVEKQESMRKKEDYNYYLENNIGLKENSVWHSLEQFHMCENYSLDVMHDLCEGIHRYSMAMIVKSFVDRKLFTLELLNSRIKYYTYSRSEHNHPPAITKQHLTNGSIVFSASEMLCFVRNFRFIIGDLIDENDEIWNYYLILLELTDILTSQVISIEHIDYLKALIQEHHETYMELFQTPLKPKYHFLLHYPCVIKKAGPPIFFSAFKFEAKHKDLKRVAKSITSRRNLCYSLGLRCELKNSCRYLSNEGFQDHIRLGKINHKNIPDDLRNDFYSVPTYEINGTIFDTAGVLLYDYKDDEPVFLIIHKIYVNSTDLQSISFSCYKLRICGYAAHFKAYHVEKSDETKFVTLTDCCDQLPLTVRSVGGRLYVSFFK